MLAGRRRRREIFLIRNPSEPQGLWLREFVLALAGNGSSLSGAAKSALGTQCALD